MPLLEASDCEAFTVSIMQWHGGCTVMLAARNNSRENEPEQTQLQVRG